ncbi:hypothetical protein FHS37_006323 [Streptomyces griseostramineus]|uniref:Uncharacterized protein n=1 Tax=Streptomyces griseomycini TaxID=66895 RepID=A0A7W7PVZ7_9ACTN|nr:hypothetical protein [Streptomyces griseomycini]MBB4902231.1 hypothetical protein [Streptomyces griseomycini]
MPQHVACRRHRDASHLEQHAHQSQPAQVPLVVLGRRRADPAVGCPSS